MVRPGVVEGCAEGDGGPAEEVEEDVELVDAVRVEDSGQVPTGRLDDAGGAAGALGGELDTNPPAIRRIDHAINVATLVEPVDEAGRGTRGQPGALCQLSGGHRPERAQQVQCIEVGGAQAGSLGGGLAVQDHGRQELAERGLARSTDGAG